MTIDPVTVMADDRTRNSYHRVLVDTMMSALSRAGANPHADSDIHRAILSEAGFSPAQIDLAGGDAVAAYRASLRHLEERKPRPDFPGATFWIAFSAAVLLLMALALASMAEGAWTEHNAARIEEGGA